MTNSRRPSARVTAGGSGFVTRRGVQFTVLAFLVVLGFPAPAAAECIGEYSGVWVRGKDGNFVYGDYQAPPAATALDIQVDYLPVNAPLVREDTATGERVVLAGLDQVRLDTCVPTGAFRYGPSEQTKCNGCSDINGRWVDITVTQPIGSAGCSHPAYAGPAVWDTTAERTYSCKQDGGCSSIAGSSAGANGAFWAILSLGGIAGLRWSRRRGAGKS